MYSLDGALAEKLCAVNSLVESLLFLRLVVTCASRLVLITQTRAKVIKAATRLMCHRALGRTLPTHTCFFDIRSPFSKTQIAQSSQRAPLRTIRQHLFHYLGHLRRATLAGDATLCEAGPSYAIRP